MRYAIDMTKFTHFKCRILWFLANLRNCETISTIQFGNISVIPRNSHQPTCGQSSSAPSNPRRPPLLSDCKCAVWILFINGNNTQGPLRLASFIEHNILKVYPCSMWHGLFFFTGKMRTHHKALTHSPAVGHWNYFQLVAIINNATMNIHIQVCLDVYLHFAWVYS